MSLPPSVRKSIKVTNIRDYIKRLPILGLMVVVRISVVVAGVVVLVLVVIVVVDDFILQLTKDSSM